MSFTSHELAALSPTGKKELRGYNGVYSFQITWRLFASAGDDGPDAALDYVEANIARIEDAYLLAAVASSSSSPSPSGDSNAKSTLKSIDVDRVQGSANPWVWLAKLTYEEPEGSGDEEDPQGGGDPTDFSAEMEIQTVQYSRPADKAIYVSGFYGKAAAAVNDSTRRPIVNSALMVLDPAPEVDDHRFAIRIKKNLATLDCDTVRCNVINSKAITISYRGVSKTIPKLCGKTRDIRVKPIRHPIIGWYVEVEFWIDVDTKNDWRLEILDRGFSARALVGDDDGRGGVIQTDSRGYVTGMAPQRRCIDSEGHPCSEPVLLNGDGAELLKYNRTSGPMTPVYGVWKYYDEEDFGTWAILADMIVSSSSP